jgi:hypothetical protein
LLKLSVRVGQSIAIGGPTTMRVESKSGQLVALVFDADRSVPIRIIPDACSPTPRSEPVGLGLANEEAPGLGSGNPSRSA